MIVYRFRPLLILPIVSFVFCATLSFNTAPPPKRATLSTLRFTVLEDPKVKESLHRSKEIKLFAIVLRIVGWTCTLPMPLRQTRKCFPLEKW